MFNVLNIFELVLLLVLGTIYLFGLGSLLVYPLLFRKATGVANRRIVATEIAFIILSGLITNLVITLLVQKITISTIIGGSLSIIGLVLFMYPRFVLKNAMHIERESMKQLLFALLLCAITLGPILLDPLVDWDARSIWFLHGKMIYYANSLGLSAGWLHPSILISHIDYPLLVPALAAQIMHIFGYWNEYLPKISLFFMWIPAIIWMVTFAKKTFSFFLLIIMIPFSFFPWIWDGYMDGLLATYYAISMLLFVRFIRQSKPIDLISSLICLIVLMNIKNEGALAIFSGLTAFAGIFFFSKGKLSWNIKKLIHWNYFFAVILSTMPIIIWFIYKKLWNFSNDLEIGTLLSLDRLVTRLCDGSLITILKYILLRLDVALMILTIILIIFVLWKIPIKEHIVPVIISVSIFTAGIIFIYLTTPMDLVWHLKTSVPRTMLSVNGMIIIVCYLLLESLEESLFLREI